MFTQLVREKSGKFDSPIGYEPRTSELKNCLQAEGGSIAHPERENR